MATYSLATTGMPADETPGLVETLTIPDSMVPVSGTTLTTATLGGMQLAQQQGTQLLCKRADGSFGLYVLDAERSTPTVPVLRAV